MSFICLLQSFILRSNKLNINHTSVHGLVGKVVFIFKKIFFYFYINYVQVTQLD